MFHTSMFYQKLRFFSSARIIVIISRSFFMLNTIIYHLSSSIFLKLLALSQSFWQSSTIFSSTFILFRLGRTISVVTCSCSASLTVLNFYSLSWTTSSLLIYFPPSRNIQLSSPFSKLMISPFSHLSDLSISLSPFLSKLLERICFV